MVEPGSGGNPGRLIARVRYTAFGEPSFIEPADFDGDGVVTEDDETLFLLTASNFASLAPGNDPQEGNTQGWTNLLDFDGDGVLEIVAPTVDDLVAFADEHSQRLGHNVGEELAGAAGLPLYRGYWFDPVLSQATSGGRAFYHVRHRVYDASRGRWIQRDPIGLAGGINLYQYCGNEPDKYYDPMGLDPHFNPTEADLRDGYQDTHVPGNPYIYKRYYYKNGVAIGYVYWSENGNKGNLYRGQQVLNTAELAYADSQRELIETLRNIAQKAQVAVEVVYVSGEMTVRVAMPVVDLALSVRDVINDPKSAMNWAGLIPFLGVVKKLQVVIKDAKGVERVVELTEAEIRALAKGGKLEAEANAAGKCEDAAGSAKKLTKAESIQWQEATPYRGKTKTNGQSGRSREYYEWDHTHGDIEVYDSKGVHMGTMDPTTGKMIKPAVPGRRIDL